jgi:hypothetical protein
MRLVRFHFSEGFSKYTILCGKSMSRSVAASLKRLDAVVSGLEKPVKARIDRLTLHANRCREKYDELKREQSEEEDSATPEEYQAPSEEPFSIDSVFVDL